MVIDMRVRPPFKTLASTHMYQQRARTAAKVRSHGYEPPAILEDPSWGTFIAEFDDSGIDLGVVPGRCSRTPYGSVSNDDLVEMVRKAGGRLVAFCSLDVDDPEAVTELERVAVLPGIVGLALDPGFAVRPHYPDDPAMKPILERCCDLDLPVMITQSGSAGPSISYVDFAAIDAMAELFPKLQFIVAHAGWPFVLEMIGVAYRHSNVWLSPDEYMVSMPGSAHWVEAAEGFLRSRMLFGSSYPFMPLAGALEHYTTRLRLPEVRQAVLGENAEGLIGPRLSGLT